MKQGERRIAFLMPSLEGGGAERVAVNLANEFVRRDYCVDMVLLRAEGDFIPDLRPEVRIVDLRAARIRGAIFPLVRYLRSVQPAAVLACMWPLTVIALLARAIARENCRIVVSEHTSWSRSPLVSRSSVAWQVAASMRLFYPLANGIVAVSRGAADDLSRFSRLDRKSISAIYNPIVNQGLVEDPDCPLEPAGWCVGGHRRVLAVGRLKAIKGYETLLRSFSLLVKRVDAKLLILGEGEQREALEALAGDLGLSERVFMPGFSRNPTPYFRHAHLHVLSSSGEGFANVIVEAMAAGTPVVSTDCLSGPREILADGKFGRLVPVGDVSALAEAMEASLSVEVDEGVLKARAREFSIEVSADQYLHLLVPAADVGSTEVEEA